MTEKNKKASLIFKWKLPKLPKFKFSKNEATLGSDTGFQKKKTLKPNSFTRLSRNEQIFFIKRLSFLMKAGVPILEGLHMIREQTRSKRQGRVYDIIIRDVTNGQTLSSSLKRFKSMFGDFAVYIIKIGESTGLLSENLEYLSEEMKKAQNLRRKVISAFIYPAIVTIATIGITSFLVFYLFPKIMPIFASLHADLPITTRILISVSAWLQHNGIWLFTALILSGIGLSIATNRLPELRYFFQRLFIRFPIVGKIMVSYNMANFTRTLGLLIKSGVTLSEALPITADTTRNLVYKRQFDAISHSINRGEKISSHLKKHYKIFPDTAVNIIAVGERSGDLQNSLFYLSDYYELEVDEFTKNLSNMIEPALMIFMGILVGFIAVSIITPIYGITQHLQPR